MAVVDLFTALAEDRPYRQGMGLDQILKITNQQVERNALDGRIAELLADNIEEVSQRVREKQMEIKNDYELKLCRTKKEL